MQFLIKKIIFFSALNFIQFLVIKSWIWIRIWIRNDKKCWIRIRIRIRIETNEDPQHCSQYFTFNCFTIILKAVLWMAPPLVRGIGTTTGLGYLEVIWL
jgi:hypothetical protein